jgi:hypothetical protein
MPADVLPPIADTLRVSCDWLLTGEPAALDPASLWSALTDARFEKEIRNNPGSEDSVWFFYMAYTQFYFTRLSTVGRSTPGRDLLEPLTLAFIDRLRNASDPHIAAVRRRARPD